MAMDEAQRERRFRRGNRALWCRSLRNFLLWLTGFFCGIILFVGSVALIFYAFPIRSILGLGGISDTSDYVDDSIANKGIIEAINGFGEYKIGDIPVLENALKSVLEGSGVNNYITVDYDKLSDVHFTYPDERNFASELQACLAITASIDSIGGKEMLGDLSVLSLFEWEEATADPESEDFEPKLYYYVTEDGSEETAYRASGFATDLDNATFARAFTDDGEYVDGVDGTTQLYLASLDKVPLVEAKDLITKRMASVTVRSLLDCFGGLGDNGGTITALLGDKTISDLSTFSIDEVELNDIIPESDSAELYKILRGATNKTSGEKLYIGDLNGLDVEEILLSDFLDETENADLFGLLRSAARLENGADLTIGSLNEININNIKLTDVLKASSSNEKLYDILSDVTGKTSSEITLDDLGSFNTDNIHLSKIIPVSSNGSLYNLLLDATGCASAEAITVGNLSGGFNMNNVKLSSVLDRNSNDVKDNPLLKALLFNGAGEPDDSVTLGNISEKINNKKLSEIFAVECFTSAKSGSATYSYNAAQKKYVLDATGQYSISDKAGIWFLLLYDSEGKDANGNPTSLTESGITFKDMQSGVSSVNEKLLGATVRLLVNCGVLQDNVAYTGKYNRTILEILLTP